MIFTENTLHTIQCPKCQSSHKKKNGFRRGKQSYKCKDCGYQFVENPISRKYPPEVKQICLKMYLNGLGFRAIARVTEIDQTTIINWVKEEGESLPDAPPEEEIPEMTEIDELQTFVGRKQNKFWNRSSSQSLESRNSLMGNRRSLSSDF